MSNSHPLSDNDIDEELAKHLVGYYPDEEEPNWGNAAMREAYRVGWEAGRDE